MADVPTWVEENRQLKARLDLPEYEPPRFADGTHTYEIVDPLEAEYGREIRFVGKDTAYLDDWDVMVDQEAVLTIGRHRDENGNTVFELSADEFDRRLRDALDRT